MIPLSPEVCPPLVEKWQAQEVHRRMQANKREASKGERDTKMALLRGGYLLCGYCGRPMYCMLSVLPSKPPRYRCRSVNEHQEGHGIDCTGKGFTVHHDELDQAVWQGVVNHFSDPDWFERIVAEERQRQEHQAESKTNRLAELDETLVANEAGDDHLVAMTSKITSIRMRQKLQDRMNEVGAEIEALEQQRAALLVPPYTEENLRAQQEAFRRWAEDAKVGLEEELAIEEKRRVLYWLGAQVKVFRSPDSANYELALTWRGLNAGRPLIIHEGDTVSSS